MHKLKRVLTAPARFIYKFTIFKMLLPLVYLFSKKDFDRNRVLFIEVRVPSLSNNFRLLWDRLEGDGRENIMCSLHLGSCSAGAYIKNCVNMARLAAGARCIFISEGSTAFSCLPIRKETTVIQTWHGCGAFKRVGMSALGNGGNVTGGRLERKLFPMCRHMDFITISSPGVAWAYEEAFDLKKGDGQKICPVGTSRTDVFFMPERIAAAKERIVSKLPDIGEKKIILYAPTFRGETTNAVMPKGLRLEKLCPAIEKDYVLLIKHHPVVKEKQEIPEKFRGTVFDMTDEPIDDLLMSADICVSDYSSLVFDYSLLERPMIFFTYDLEDYSGWRGLYYPLEDFCPGKIVRTTEELAAALSSGDIYDTEKMSAFHELHMASCDGHATDRIIALMDTVPDKNKKGR